MTAPQSPHIHMAPLQGLTCHLYREAYFECFPGVDFTYSPFVMLQRGALRGRDERELEAGKAEGERFTPQIIAATPGEAASLTRTITDKGFNRLNLNLGCPFPMLTKRGRGAGLLPHPERVDDILEAIYAVSPGIRLSVKTRLGLESPREFDDIVPVLNRYPLSRVVIHPRIATQKYSGVPLWNEFEKQGTGLTALVIANGDITTRDRAAEVVELYPFIHGIMIGRGLLMDPLLPMRIRQLEMPASIESALRAFHDRLFEAYAGTGRSPAHLLDKMREHWRYFCQSFPMPHKAFKRIKKCRSVSAYHDHVDALFEGLKAKKAGGHGDPPLQKPPNL